MRIIKNFWIGLYLLTGSNALLAENYAWPLPPRLILAGIASDTATVSLDGMQALYGNPAQIIFADIQAKTAWHTSALASVGFGYRQVYQAARILGGYIFVEDNQSNQQHHFWVLNPGVESLGRDWDFRLNTYIPVSNKQVFIQQDFADNFGVYNNVSFSGHQQYDNLANLYQQIGYGADFEIARRITFINGLTAHLGSYYFNFSNTAPVKGIEGHFDYPIDQHVALSWGDSYDNVQHNLILTGLKFTFGGTNASDKDRTDIASRILDPITRNLATQDQGNGIPIANQVKILPGKYLERDNIWFFQSSDVNNQQTPVTANSCTYEHPCNSFNQQEVDAINNLSANANFYFAPGNYTALNGANSFIMRDGQSFYGRSEDYTRPAENSQKPLFLGSFKMGNHTELDSITVLNDPVHPQYQGIDIENVSDVTLNHVQVGALNSAAQGGYETGVYIYGANAHVNILNSQINAYAADSNHSPVYGIDIDKASEDVINIINSRVMAIDAGNGLIGYAQAMAISGNANNIFTIKNSQMQAMVLTQNGLGLAYGIFASLTSQNTFHINHSNIGATVQSNSGDARTFGIYFSGNSNNDIEIQHSQITANALTRYGVSDAESRALYLFNNGSNNFVAIKYSILNAMAAARAGYASAYDFDAATPVRYTIVQSQLIGYAHADDPSHGQFAPFSHQEE